MLNWYKMLELKSYSITDKLTVIARIKHDESQAAVSWDNCLPESTIQRWLTGEKSCMIFLIQLIPLIWWKEEKKARIVKDLQLDKAVFTWFLKERQGRPWWAVLFWVFMLRNYTIIYMLREIRTTKSECFRIILNKKIYLWGLPSYISW